MPAQPLASSSLKSPPIPASKVSSLANIRENLMQVDVKNGSDLYNGRSRVKSDANLMQLHRHSLRISVILPCWRDRDLVSSRIEHLSSCPGVSEVIVVHAEPGEALSGPCRTILSPEPNRGLQLHLGAKAAGGDVLLFLHCDTEFTEEHSLALSKAVENPDIIGGGFYRKFDERHPGLMWLEPWERLHCRWFGTIYGDQSIFVRRDVYFSIGGFRDFPILEDVEFSSRLRRRGKVALIGPPVRTSPRRHLDQGPWLTTLRNLCFLILYRMGVSPKAIHSWYYSQRPPSQSIKRGSIPSPLHNS